ncbi:hypothetical protein DSO57_1019378 [Entomophthora muscae]|uniref:Uncharacterized protein n=1 Tax=Entomophthora muscae TaxID=34485 RepID=A0ACC2SSY9_9FUNG|nr:hypothetical protein DSO57_1019378 [Entomophthora muscae]
MKHVLPLLTFAFSSAILDPHEDKNSEMDDFYGDNTKPWFDEHGFNASKVLDGLQRSEIYD